MGIQNAVSIIGIAVIIGIGYLISENRGRINWRTVGFGLLIQLGVAVLLFLFPLGVRLFHAINGVVNSVLYYATAGSTFLFGPLALQPGQTGPGGAKSLGFILAFQAFPTIIFFSALLSVLYYFRIMPKVISWFSRAFSRSLGLSGAESTAVTSNIVVGVESAFMIQPFLQKLTRSEIHTLLASGMATVASNVLAIYVFSLNAVFPNIAGHLVVASFLSAPAAIVMSKLLVPETDQPQTRDQVVSLPKTESTLFEGIIEAANAGVKMIVGISAVLIAVLGLMACLDAGLGWVGAQIGQMVGVSWQWSVAGGLKWVVWPIVVMIGVPIADAGLIAQLIAERLILTEVVSYQHLAVFLKNGQLVSMRSAVVATYALCGFAHLASMAIFSGGLAMLIPNRRQDISQVAPKALLAATLACLLTAAVAGLFYTSQSFLFGTS